MFYRNLLVISVFAVSLSSLSCSSNLLAGDPPAAPAAQPAPVVVDGMRTSYSDVVEKTSAAVVRIEAEVKGRQAAQTQMNPFGDDNEFFKQFPQLQPRQNQRPQIERGFGSGVIASPDGSVLTNAHVVDGAAKITVLLSDNKTYTAKVVGIDKPSDLAVLKIEGSNFPFLNLGNSDSVRVGDIVLAIGNPLGIGQTVTAGIISAKGRRTGLSDGQSFEDFLQTDAPINRGNSGGALVNLTGELIGINSQILSPGGSGGGNIGIGFSIPSNMARSVMEQLVANGRVRRGMLGINIQNITDDLATAFDLKERLGVLVSNVRPNSAADKAGIKRNDIITAINGEKIEDSNVLRNKVAGTMPGTAVKINVLRDGSSQEVTATLDEFDSETLGQSTGSAPNESPQEQGDAKLGLNLQPLTQETAKQLGLDAGATGLAVTEVDPAGAAAEAGVTRGDVILEINRKEVKTLDEAKDAIAASGERPILLLISRRGQVIYLTVRPQ